MQQLAGLINESQLNENNIPSDINVSIYGDQVELSGSSGDYSGDIEDNGTVSFSVYLDDTTDIEDQFGEEGITENNWKDVLGPDHVLVKLYNAIGGQVEAMGDYVEITVDSNKLMPSLNEVEEIEDDTLYVKMESSINETDLDNFIDAANNIGGDLLKAGYQAPQIYSYLYTVMVNQA